MAIIEVLTKYFGFDVNPFFIAKERNASSIIVIISCIFFSVERMDLRSDIIIFDITDFSLKNILLQHVTLPASLSDKKSSFRTCNFLGLCQHY